MRWGGGGWPGREGVVVTLVPRPLDLMWDEELDCTKSEAAARRRREGRGE